MPLLLWCDLETSGLDPTRDDILEAAWAVTSLEKPFVVRAPSSRVMGYRKLTVKPEEGSPDWARAWKQWDPVVVEMHTKNGLLEECRASTTEVYDVEAELLAVVPQVEDKDERTILAGSTIGFDLGFLKVHAPTLAARLSHRLYDVSAVKLFCRSLGMPPLPKAEAHRAAADVLESVDHARRCAEWLRP